MEESPGHSSESEHSEESPHNVCDELTDCLHYKGKKYEDLKLEDLNGVQFKSVEEVDQFYSYYSLAIGFSVRKNKADKNCDQLVRRRQLVCSRQGKRRSQAPKKQKFGNEENHVNPDISCQRENKKQAPPSRKVTRCNCPARLTALLCKTKGVYYVVEFITEHNHELVRREHIRFLRSHTNVVDHDMAQVTAMRKVSVSTCQGYELLVHQAGGYEYVGFTLKHLYNHLESERREIMVDGDCQAAISFMNLKASLDPHFCCFFCVDQHGRLANLFWRDSQSLIDYKRFGDVLIMDTTYKTNIYGKPLAVFVGINNHRATVLFGCALLADETEDTYKWAVSSFLSSMDGKKPISVITDGDEAMWNAVAYLIPDSRQRLCAWHISKNVCSNIHDVAIQKDFFHLIYAGLAVQEWEAAWHYMVAMKGLENNTWLTDMYNKRNRWAETFFRDHFFAGVCSTQRCECMHRSLKGGLGHYMRLFEILPRIDKTIARMRDAVLEDDSKSINSDPVIGSHLQCLQEQIASKFTHDIFLLLKDQIGFESKFVIYARDELPDQSASLYNLTQYNKPERRWVVTYHGNNSTNNPSLKCSCKLFESDGIPCCHIFAVMKALMITVYPESLVMKRWTKDAGLSTIPSSIGGFPDNAVRVARYADMMAKCAHICFAASFSDEGYEATMDSLRRLNIRSQKFPVPVEQSIETNEDGLHNNIVKGPVICRTKGTHTKPPNMIDPVQARGERVCGFCSRPGHNILTCDLATEAGIKHPSSALHEDSNRAGDVGVDDQYPTDTLIHHLEESRTFDFFAGYDNPVNTVSGSMTLGNPNTTSLATGFVGHSFGERVSFRDSTSLSHTQ